MITVNLLHGLALGKSTSSVIERREGDKIEKVLFLPLPDRVHTGERSVKAAGSRRGEGEEEAHRLHWNLRGETK